MAVVKLKSMNSSAVNAVVSSISDLQTRLPAADLQHAPIKVQAIAEMLGLAVVYEVMDDSLSGYLELRGDKWIVGVNELHHPVRQRFTIAHEIAHYVLHRELENKFIDQTFARRSVTRDLMEKEADQFAADLLMPADLVRGQVKGGNRALHELAAAFDVSALAMQYRLRALGYKIKHHA